MKAPADIPGVSGETCARKVTSKMSPARSILRGAYPCSCRLCTDLARTTREPKVSRLAAIDVYDLPDEALEGARVTSLATPTMSSRVRRQ